MTKICAVITSTQDIADARSLGAEAFEFRLDLFSNLADDLSFLSQPELTIATCRPGSGSDADERRRELFAQAIAAGVDYVDIESDSVLRDAFPGKTICSYHDFEKTPDTEGILAIFSDLAQSGVPKAAFMVHGIADLAAIAEAAETLRGSGKPFILIGMGEAGKLTRIRASLLGSCVSYCAVSKESGSAPGQLTVAEAASLGEDPAVCGVIGYPLTKTFSPAIHTAAFAAANIAGAYVKIPTPVDEVSLVLDLMRLYDMRGLNVTIPHKQSVMPMMDNLSPAAEAIQAVNTIIRDPVSETFSGDNTDWLGIAATLDEFVPEDKEVLLLGAGGAAFAAAFYFKERGARLTIANRTAEKAAALAERVGADAVLIEDLKPEYDIVLNASPVCPAEVASCVKAGTIAMDMVYPDSAFLQAAKRCGAVTRSGMTMLIHQGAASFEHWHGIMPDTAAMTAAFLEAE